MATRIHVLLASAAETAVILRRGPTKQVQMLLWHTGSDTIEPGQWFKGRVFEHRCDLSPNGSLLVYFAAKHKPPFGTWTAVSRPPYFTALALWPKGDSYGGGGFFESDRLLRLNHGDAQRKLADGFTVPKGMRIQSAGEWAGRGEDQPLSDQLMLRRGWANVSPGRSHRAPSDDVVSWVVDPPEVWERTHPQRAKASTIRIRRRLTGVHVEDGPWYRFAYELAIGDTIAPLEGADWADFDARGDLLVAADGQLYRIPEGRRIDQRQHVADLRQHQFEPLAPPDWATRWP